MEKESGSEYKKALLLSNQKNCYYEKCPGCKVEQQKRLQRGLPVKNLITVWIVVLASGMLFIWLHDGMHFLYHVLVILQCVLFFSYFVMSPNCSTSNIISVSIPIFHGKHSNISLKLISRVCVSFVCPIYILYLQVRDFQIAKREEDIGFYAGYIGMSYSFRIPGW